MEGKHKNPVILQSFSWTRIALWSKKWN